MRVDWSTAEVLSSTQGSEFTLRVRLVDVGGNPYYDAFAIEARAMAGALGGERRRIERYMTGGSTWGIDVSPIDPDDVDGERRLLEDFVERINRRAAPDHARSHEEARRQRAEADARAPRAKELTDRFRQQ